MEQGDGAGRPGWFGCAAALWMVFGTMMLVGMTAWNGVPLPAGVPGEPLPLIGFLAANGFVYGLPVWLLVKERRYSRARQERPSYGPYLLCAVIFAGFWTVLLVPGLFA